MNLTTLMTKLLSITFIITLLFCTSCKEDEQLEPIDENFIPTTAQVVGNGAQLD